MLFNSISFVIFLPLVFICYWSLNKKSPKVQNLFLLIASYYFYACWDYRFLFLLIFSTSLDYFTALKISNTQNKNQRKFWFWTSISINLCFLGIFKYFDFFSTSFTEAASHWGFQTNPYTLNIILPVGISFYTFHGISYIIDIYKDRISAEKNIIDYSLFVSFFPLLVAGPIERATHLLPQIKQKRTFDYVKAVDGLKQILWGLFKKIVIADNCAEYANIIFNNSENYPGSMLFIGAIFFTIQIYGDFSGYSDIALGSARLLGIELLRNFSFPYFSRDIAEFWRRWHISLSSWFRDYIYIPLGGNKGSLWKKIRNTFVIFIISGLWHGANWTFIVWGILNAIYFLPLLLSNTNRIHLDVVAQGKILPSFIEILKMLTTFILTVFAWIFFRSENIKQAFEIITEIFSPSLFQYPSMSAIELSYTVLILLFFFFITEWIGREGQFAIQQINLKFNCFFRWSFYSILIIFIYYYAFMDNNKQFIYFQF